MNTAETIIVLGVGAVIGVAFWRWYQGRGSSSAVHRSAPVRVRRSNPNVPIADRAEHYSHLGEGSKGVRYPGVAGSAF